MWILRIILIVFLSTTFTVFAQSPKVIRVLENELPSTKVWCTYQDKLGYLWIATSEGLCRYDGNQLEIYTKEDGLWSNNITWLSETDNGDLLVVCLKKGINLIQTTNKPTIKKFAKSPVNYDIYLKGNFITSRESIHIENKDEFEDYFDRFDHYFDLLDDKSVKPTRIINNNKNTILANSKLGLHEINLKTKKDSLLFSHPNDSSFYALHKPNDNDTYIGSLGKIYYLENYELQKNLSKGLPEDININFIITDEQKNIYCNVVNEGLFIKKINSEEFEIVDSHPDLDKTNINHLTIDKEGNIWASSWGKGLLKISGAPVVNYSNKSDLNILSIQQLCYVPENKELFISCLDDIYYFKNKKCIPLEIPKVNDLEVNINTLLAVGKNIIGGKQIANYKLSVKPKITKSSFYLEDVRRLCVSSEKSDSIWSIEKKKFYKCYKVINDALIAVDSIKNTNSLSQYLNEPFYIADNKIWQATRDGLYYEDINNQFFYNSSNDELNFFKGLFQNTIINKIYANSTDSIWFGTDKGLIGRINEKWKTIPELDKLKNKNIKDIAFDNEGHVWFVTKKDLCYYDYQNLYVFREEHGFLQKEFSYLEYDTNEEKVIVANINGMSIAKKDDLLNHYKLNKNEFILKSIIIDSLEVNDWNNISLNPDQKEIQFNMSLLNFSTSANPYFEYKLNNNEWLPLEKGKLSLRNLQDDNYEIQFRASNDNVNSIYSEKIQFNVLPVWYKTIGFLVFVIFLIILAATLISLFFIRLNKRLADQKVKNSKRIAFLEQKALASSMNPHFIFNVLNAIQELIQKKDVLTTNHYIAKFGNLMRLYLQSSLEATVSVYDEMERIELYCEMEKLRFKENIQYSINISDEVDSEFFTMPSMSLQPYVENAIKHGIQPKGKGSITINCFCSDNEELLIFEIIDDGVGIKQTQNFNKTEGMNVASEITKERIKLFGAEEGKSGSVIYLQNEPNGTIVKIILPIITL